MTRIFTSHARWYGRRRSGVIDWPTRAGFTLVETVIVIGLVVVMMAALATLYVSFNTSTLVQKSLVDNTSRLAHSFVTLRTDINQAQALLASHTFDSGTTYFTGVTALVLVLPASNASGEIVDSAYDYVAYYLEGGSFYRRIDADAASSRADGVTLILSTTDSLIFTYDNVDVTQATRATASLTSAPAPRTGVVSQLVMTASLYNHS